MKTTLKDLLHAINIIGEDRDVFVDGIDAIAVCPLVKLTKYGLEYYKQALEAEVVVDYNTFGHVGTYVSDEEEINDKAWQLLCDLAGNCGCNHFDKCFEGDDAEIL